MMLHDGNERKMTMRLFEKWFGIARRFRLKDASLFKRFMISYIIVLIIPLFLTGIFIFSSINGMISKAIKSSTLNNISQTQDIIDMRIRELNNAAMNLLQNPLIQPLIITQDLGSISEYSYYSLMREFRNYRNTNVMFDEIYVYFRNSDIIISSVGKLRLSQFYNQSFRYQRDWNTFKDILDTVSDTQIMPIETVYEDNAPKQILTYLTPFPRNEINYKGTLMITVNASSITKVIRNVLGDNKGQVCVIDEKSKVISLADNGVSLSKENIEHLLGHKNQISETKINGKTQMVFYSKSLQTGWSYLAILPSEQIMVIVNRMKRLSIIILIISMILGGYMVYYFSYWNFNPIKHIFEVVSKLDKPNQPISSSNELNLIETIMNSTIAKNIDLEKRLKEQSPVIKADFLRNLLNGGYDDLNYVDKMCEFCNIRQFIGPFAVMVFAIDDYDENIEHDLISSRKLLKFSLTNIVEGFSQDIGSGYAVGIAEGNVGLIIDFAENDYDPIEKMHSIGTKTIEFFENNLNLTLTVGIGRIYNKITDIVKSQVEATSAVEYKMIMGRNKVIIYENIETTKRDRFYYPVQNETIIIDALKNGDYDIIKEILASTIAKIKNQSIDIIVARCVYFEIVNTAMKALTELELEDYTEIMIQDNTLPNLLRCETLNELYEQVVSFYKAICNKIQSTKTIKKSNFKNDIIQYIKDNYDDQNLSLTQMAGRFKVSPTYLSRFFGNKTQYNFVEYVHRLRLKKAKQLLENTDRNISDIAITVGYTDSHSLIRAFKKYENVTPGRFREMKIVD